MLNRTAASYVRWARPTTEQTNDLPAHDWRSGTNIGRLNLAIASLVAGSREYEESRMRLHGAFQHFAFVP
jgi:hypothetical protein